MSALQKDLLRKGLPPLPPPTGMPSSFHGPTKRKRRDYTPLPWTDYFDRMENVTTSGGTFRVYVKGTSGPVLLLLHGGGHSALSWAVFAEAVTGLVDCTLVAMDMRGHGHTAVEGEADLSADVLARDVGEVAKAMNGDDQAPAIVLLGHSMGGAIAVRVAAAGLIPSLVGLAVIDVVEGTAMDSLSSMQNFLRGRPSSFKSVEQAIEWSIRCGQLKNIQSARVSMPGQIRRRDCTTSVDVTCAEDHTHQQSSSQTHASATRHTLEEVEEEEEEEDRQGGMEKKQKQNDTIKEGIDATSTADRNSGVGSGCGAGRGSCTQAMDYVWRIDLSATAPFWQGWFTGLSKLFLSSPVPKMLILAGVDRLDKELTIGQMQGKFQMCVMSGCGHAVHEDVPDKVADIIGGFLVRQKLTVAKEAFKRPLPMTP